MDPLEKFGVTDSLAGDTGHGPDRRGLTAEEIVDRAQRKAESWRFIRRRLWQSLAAAVVLLAVLIALYQPVHAWLQSHGEFILGFFFGSTAEAVVWWLVDRRRWLQRFQRM